MTLKLGSVQPHWAVRDELGRVEAFYIAHAEMLEYFPPAPPNLSWVRGYILRDGKALLGYRDPDNVRFIAR